MKLTFDLAHDFANQLDEKDVLSDFRKQFYFSGDNTIYLDGNSLGRLPLKTKTLIADVVGKQWGTHLIESWNKNWYTKPEELGNKIAKIIGASDGDEKSKMQSEYFIFLTMKILSKHGFEIGSPLNSELRGSHISLKHSEAYRICQSLVHPKNGIVKIIPDFREPDNIRFGFTPLYTTFEEIWQTTGRLKIIMETREYESFGSERNSVT